MKHTMVRIAMLVSLALYTGVAQGCYSAGCQAAPGSCFSCGCPGGGQCGWTGGGCVCAQRLKEPGVMLNATAAQGNFLCKLEGSPQHKGTFIFQGLVGGGQTVTCPAYAPGVITAYGWARHEGCKSGGVLTVAANMVNFRCECTKLFGGCTVANTLVFDYA